MAFYYQQRQLHIGFIVTPCVVSHWPHLTSVSSSIP